MAQGELPPSPSASWFRRVFGFDEQQAERTDISRYCASHSAEVGVFHEVCEWDMPMELLAANTPMNVSMYMCKQLRTGHLGFLQYVECGGGAGEPAAPQQMVGVFHGLRDTGAITEVLPPTSGQWRPAARHQAEAFAKYKVLCHNHGRNPIRTPFFNMGEYQQVALFLSPTSYFVHGLHNIGDTLFREQGLILEHQLTYDLTAEHTAAAFGRGERAMFQADSNFNYIECAEYQLPSDGIRNYGEQAPAERAHGEQAHGEQAQAHGERAHGERTHGEQQQQQTHGQRCAVATPAAALARNWLMNSDDVQHNGLGALVRALDLYQELMVVNGRSAFTTGAMQRLQRGEALWDAATLYAHVRQHLRIACTFAPLASMRPRRHVSVGNAWCAALNMRGLSTEQRRTLRPLALAVLAQTYRLVLRVASYHPQINVVYLTALGARLDVDTEIVVEAINTAVDSFRFAPIRVVILHERAFNDTLKRGVRLPASAE
jgi:hypothetical protein